MNTAKLLFRGAGLQVVAMVVSLASSFFLAPYVIHSLGDHWYGLWVLIGTFVGFYGLLDFGISSATQRYLADAMPRGDAEELNTIVASSLVMFCGIALLALLVTVGIAFITPLFMTSLRGATIFQEVTLIMGGGFALSLPFYTQFGIFSANLRLDYSSYVRIGHIVLRTALFFLVLGLGYGIVKLALASVASDIVQYATMTWLARRLTPWLKLRRRHFALAKMRELISFGVYSFVAQIAGTIKFRLDNIVIAGYLGLAPVTHFNIATKLNGYFFGALNSLVPAPTSLYARYHGRGELQQIRDKFIILSRIKGTLGMLGIGAVLIFARPFISLWVGEKYLDAFLPLVIIMGGRILSTALSPGVGAMYALAKHRFTAFTNLGEAIANLALSLLLVRYYGIIGVALGTAIPLLATRLTILPIYFCRVMELPIPRLVRSVVPLMVLAVVLQVPLVYAVSRIRIDTYWQIMVWGACYYLPLLAFFYLVMLTREERRLFSEALPAWPLKRKGGRLAYTEESRR
ncbi:MAG TPA: oligosaccharide flippase family protein [Gammaproteobacteria bacterium]|nr:oligosaccharide flippase family protein [Gammaproteobacteria bacterium]